MIAEFEPVNPLERALLQVLREERTMTEFLPVLAASPVVILVQEEPEKNGALKGPPLVLRNDAEQDLLAIFTSVDRAIQWLEYQQGYPIALTLDCHLVMPGIVDGFGIVLNPTQTGGLELEPESISSLKRLAKLSAL
jgi:hypothetical protein